MAHGGRPFGSSAGTGTLAAPRLHPDGLPGDRTRVGARDYLFSGIRDAVRTLIIQRLRDDERRGQSAAFRRARVHAAAMQSRNVGHAR